MKKWPQGSQICRAPKVTADLDNGPIIAQDVIRISHRDLVEDLIRHGKDWEKIVLPQAVRLHLENRVRVYKRLHS